MEMNLCFKFKADDLCWEGSDEDEFGRVMACLLDMVNTYCQYHYIDIVECEKGVIKYG